MTEKEDLPKKENRMSYFYLVKCVYGGNCIMT